MAVGASKEGHSKGDELNFIVSDRASIEEGIIVRSSYVVISIRDPDKKKARIPKQSGLKDVLYLAFHDAEPAANMKLADGIVLMTERQAREVWDFVRRHEGSVGAIVVHCEQGMSRSPAVAAALCQNYGGDHRHFFRDHQPNMFVYRLMMSCGNAKGEVEQK